MALTYIKSSGIDITGSYTVNGMTVTANLTSGNANLGNLATANYFTGTLTTNTQPNITSVGTLVSLSVTGNISAGNVKTDNILYANGTAWTFSNYSNTNVASYLPTYTGNITGNIVTLTGNVTAINANLGNLVTSNYFTGNGSLLTSLTGANVTGTVANATYATTAGSATSATTAGTVTTAAQPNITSVGTLSSVSVTGNVTAGNILTDHILYANGTAWTFSNYSNTNVASYLPTYTGNVSANYFIGNGSTLTHITGGNVDGQVGNALVAGTVYTNAQPNITSIGTLSGLTGTGVFNLGGTSNVTLGAVGNVHISGGSANAVLQTDGSGTLSWATLSPTTSVTVDSFTGDGTTVAYTLTSTPANVKMVTVNYNGIILMKDTYSVAGTTLTFVAAPESGYKVEITTVTSGSGGGGTSSAASVGYSLVFGG